MRIFRQRGEIAHAVITGARFETIVKRQRTQRGVTARAAAADDESIPVDIVAFQQIARGVDAVGHVDYAPVVIKPTTIIPPEAATATVVHINYGKATAGPILYAQLESVAGGRCRPAVADHDQRWLFVVIGQEIRISGPVKKSKCREIILRWKFN